jgi:PAS domain S-box-containing protein
MIAQDHATKGDGLEEIPTESEQGFHSLVENAVVGIGVTDLRGRLTYANRALADLLGYSVQELQGRDFRSLIHPDERTKMVQLFLKAILLRRQLRNIEFRVLRKDGRVRTLWSRPSRFIVNGRTVGFQAIVVDITERKEIEKKLMETNRKLETFFDASMEGITVVDANENLTFVNKAFADTLGYKEEELIGINLRKLVDEKGFKEIRAQTESRKKGKVSRYELAIYDKNGKARIAQVSASPLWNEDGHFAGSLAIVMDVTERKRMEEALQESEEKFRKIFQSANDSLIYLDTSGMILDVNEKAVQTFGGSKEKLLGRHFIKVGIFSLRDIPKLLSVFARILNGREAYTTYASKTRKIKRYI